MKEKKPAAIVTGNAGFLGFALTKKLLSEGYIVFGIDDRSNKVTWKATQADRRALVNNFVEFEEDVSDVEIEWVMDRIPRWLQVDYVFHLASLASPDHYKANPLHTLWTNAAGLKNMIDLADTFRARLIYTSSSEVYGDPSESPQGESLVGRVALEGPRAVYNEAKRFGEVFLRASNEQRGTNHGVVRLFNAYGPYMPKGDGRVISNFLSSIIEGKPPMVYGSGTQTRTFCFVDDTIEGIWAYAKSGAVVPVNVGGEDEISIEDLAYKLTDLFGQNFVRDQSQADWDDPTRRKPDLTKIKALGWAGPTVSLDEGLKRTYEWMKQQEGSKPDGENKG